MIARRDRSSRDGYPIVRIAEAAVHAIRSLGEGLIRQPSGRIFVAFFFIACIAAPVLANAQAYDIQSAGTKSSGAQADDALAQRFRPYIKTSRGQAAEMNLYIPQVGNLSLETQV
jgi:hypothetical protein